MHRTVSLAGKASAHTGATGDAPLFLLDDPALARRAAVAAKRRAALAARTQPARRISMRCAFLVNTDPGNQCVLKPQHYGAHVGERDVAPDDSARAVAIHKTFAYHRPGHDGMDKITQLRSLFSAVADQIDALCPHSRERSIALTELETCAMWAIKAVVINDPESTVV